MRQTILLAEDNEHDVVLFQHQMRAARILNPVQVVTDGEQATDYLNGNGRYSDRTRYPLPMVLFLDLRLPKIDGKQILSFIRSNAPLRHLPVVILSVIDELSHVAEAYQRGATTFVVKPLVPTDLLQVLRAIPNLRLDLEPQGHRFLESDASLGQFTHIIPPPGTSGFSTSAGESRPFC